MRQLQVLQDADLSFFNPDRLQHQEEAVRAAGESMANKHSEELSLVRNEAMDVKRKLHQAEITVNDVVHHAERELVARTEAQNAANSMPGQLNMLTSEMVEVTKNYDSWKDSLGAVECLTVYEACYSFDTWNCYAPRNGCQR